MIDKVCKNCDYFEPYKEYIAENCGFIGLCYRYPDYRNVANGHWCGEWKLRRGRIRMTKEEAVGVIERLPVMSYMKKNEKQTIITTALDMAIEALQEQERIIKLLEELRDDPIMYCSEDYWEGHYMAAKEAIAIVRGEAE